MITGSSSSIGRQIELTFADEGANVVTNSRALERATGTADEIRERGAAAIPVEADISDRGSVGSLVTDERQATRSKVWRLISAYGLSDIGEELEESWTGRGRTSRSLRELADFFNRHLLRTAMEDAGMNPLEGEVENMYRLLTSDTASAGARTQAETTLERAGLEADGLRREFVSHQAIHTYLTKYRGVEWTDGSDDVEAKEKVKQSIQRLQSRLVAVVEKNLNTFRSNGRLTLGSFDVFVSIQVYCADCGTQYALDDRFSRDGCDCESTS